MLIFLEWTITPIFNPGSWLERSVRVTWHFSAVFPARIQASSKNCPYSMYPQTFFGHLSAYVAARWKMWKVQFGY
jgi:hypothetical protein